MREQGEASERRKSMGVLAHICVSILWFALYAQWLTVVPVIVPDQVRLMVGEAFKEGISGSVVAAGAVMSLVVTPLAGAWSDRLRSRFGRRRPFLVVGMIGTSAALCLLLLFGSAPQVLLYTLAFVHLQFWWNLAAGPYAGLVADVVPKQEQGKASAWLNVMSILGTVIGNGLIAAFYHPGRPGTVIAIFVALNILCLIVTLRGVKEPSSEGNAVKREPLLRGVFPPLEGNANFYWVLVTRLFANMGIWSIFTFLVFYLRDVIHIEDATSALPALLGAGAVLAVPASVIGIRLAARHGLVAIVRGTSWIMAITTLCYVLIAFHPNFYLIVPVVIIFSAAYGAYQAVDWALALAVLPSGEDAGKDMGIWHISMVLPQILGPAGSGWMISLIIAGHSAALAYTFAFGVAALWFVVASVLVKRVRI
jgi:Na+/melibiose symporter-like transporter